MSNENDTWNKLYSSYIESEFKNWDEYFKIKMQLKKRFLKLVLKYSYSGKPILECGSGTGKFAAYLATFGKNSYAIDREQAMVEQSKFISNKISPENPVKVFKGDIIDIRFEDKFFSVTHSSGVLEHYNDDEIVKMINEQIRVSDYCIFSVPTKYFEKKMLGNERFMSRKQWRKIIDKSNGKIIKETGYHYKKLKNRIVDIINKPTRIFKPIAMYVFVLRDKEEKNDLYCKTWTNRLEFRGKIPRKNRY